MIKVKFGLPRAGKTTDFAREALRNRHKYRHIYGNVHMSVPGYTYIPDSFLGIYQLDHALILIDEATLLADNRDFKSMKKTLVQFLVLHGHYKVDIIFYVQKWDAIDIKIRSMTQEVYYIRKAPILGRWLSYEYRIPYGIEFSNPKTDGHRYGEIIMGYGRPRIFDRVFKGVIIRPLYYKYFDSWEAPALTPLPAHVVANPLEPSLGERLYHLIRRN